MFAKCTLSKNPSHIRKRANLDLSRLVCGMESWNDHVWWFTKFFKLYFTGIRNLTKKITFFAKPRCSRQKWLLVKQCLFHFYVNKKNRSVFFRTEVAFWRQWLFVVDRSDNFSTRKNRKCLYGLFFYPEGSFS